MSADGKLRVVLYQNNKNPRPTHRLELAWEQFCETVLLPEESLCTVGEAVNRLGQSAPCAGSSCPYKSTSSIPNNPMAWSPVQLVGTRKDANVRSVSCLTLDYDGLTAEQRRSVEARLAGRAHVLYTTHSHRGSDDQPDHSFRVALQLTRPVLASEWHRFLRVAVEYLGASVEAGGKQQPDRTCKDRSRLYYRHSNPAGAPSDAYARAGAPLDVEEVLAWGRERVPLADTPAGQAGPLVAGGAWDLSSQSVEDAIDAVDRFFPANRRHELALALGGRLRRAGATLEDARYIIREAFRRGGSDDPDARADTVYHTYEVEDGDELTGYTRVCEILGDEGAAEFGAAVDRAKDEAFVKRLEKSSRESKPQPSGGAGGGEGEPDRPRRSYSVEEVRAELRRLAAKKSRSEDWDGAGRTGILLRRLADGRTPFTTMDGVGDVELQSPALPGVGIPAVAALRRTFNALGYAMPDVPWEVLLEVVRPALAVPGRALEEWADMAKKLFEGAQFSKRASDAQREIDIDERREAVREAAAAPPPPPPLPGAPAASPPVPEDTAWQDMLMKDSSGVPLSNTFNARVILTHHDDFRGLIRWNEVSKEVSVVGGPLAKCASHHSKLVRWAQDYLASAHGIDLKSESALYGRLEDVSRDFPFDPIRDYLDSLVWDRVERVEQWTTAYLDAEDYGNDAFVAYNREVGRRWLIALVARGYEPGCKMDNVLVLQGPGGIGKSAVFKIFGGEWYSDTMLDLGDKDSRMMAARYWLCELAECVALKKTTAESLKNFFSVQEDVIRPPYERDFQKFKRRAIFGGTTNEDEVLTDETGNRKYWPLRVRKLDLAALREDRDQLLAEAVHLYKSGVRWHFTADEILVINEVIDNGKSFTPADFWEAKVKSWWYAKEPRERPSELTINFVTETIGQLSAAQATRGTLIAVGWGLKKAGFTKNPSTRTYLPSLTLVRAPKRTVSSSLFTAAGS